MEEYLNIKFTTKGYVVYDQYNRKPFEIKKVDSMFNSRITSNDDGLQDTLFLIQEKVRAIRTYFDVPDVQK